MPYSNRKLFDLARIMISQAKLLRDAGAIDQARALAKRAIELHSTAWLTAKS